MPTPKSLAGYPAWFFTIAERAQSASYSEELEMTSRGAAINLRQRFYAFRQLLAESGHPHAQAMLDLVLSIDGNTLKFSKMAGLTPGAIAQLGVEVSATAPELGSANRPDRVFASDAAEAQLEQMLRGNAQVEEPKPEQCPPHEWDPAQTCCLKCGVPYET